MTVVALAMQQRVRQRVRALVAGALQLLSCIMAPVTECGACIVQGSSSRDLGWLWQLLAVRSVGYKFEMDSCS